MKRKHSKPTASCVSVPYASDVSVAASSNEPVLLKSWIGKNFAQPLMPTAFCGTLRVENAGF